MRTIILIAAFLCAAGCETIPPKESGCVESDYRTHHDSKEVVCRLVTCRYTIDGAERSDVVSLWCDEVKPPPACAPGVSR